MLVNPTLSDAEFVNCSCCFVVCFDWLGRLDGRRGWLHEMLLATAAKRTFLDFMLFENTDFVIFGLAAVGSVNKIQTNHMHTIISFVSMMPGQLGNPKDVACNPQDPRRHHTCHTCCIVGGPSSSPTSPLCLPSSLKLIAPNPRLTHAGCPRCLRRNQAGRSMCALVPCEPWLRFM